MNVYQAVATVMGALPAIGRDEHSPQGYSYRGIEAITAQLQPLLAKHGVIIVPSATITKVVPSPGATKDTWQDVYVEVDWCVYGPEGDSLVARTTGIGRDNSDKGANKGQTQAFKYLLLALFVIGDRTDDGDAAATAEELPRRPARKVAAEPSAEAPAVTGGGSASPPPTLASDRQALGRAMNGITDGEERRSVKAAFKAQFGSPDELGADQVDAAYKWVGERTG